MGRTPPSLRDPKRPAPGLGGVALRVRPAASAGGFTFLEILTVMGIMAILLGLGVGFLTGVGKSARSFQAASIVGESGLRCQNMSAGGRRATLDIRKVKDAEGNERLTLTTAVQRGVLSAAFEAAPADRPGQEWFVNVSGSGELARPNGDVQIVPSEKSGSGVKLGPNGWVDFGTRSGFAMTDGMLASLWILPSAGRGGGTLLKCAGDGQNLWTLELRKGTVNGPDAYDVVLRLWLVPAGSGEGASVGAPMVYETKGAPVRAGSWSLVEASFDGRDPSLKIDGYERFKRDPKTARLRAADPAGTMTFPLPKSGAAQLQLSAPGSGSFQGIVDTLNVAGIFRTDEDVRPLPFDVDVVRPTLPVRVTFANGRLDPTIHAQDVVIWLVGPGDGDSGSAHEIRFGLYGSLPPPRRVPAPGIVDAPAMGGGAK